MKTQLVSREGCGLCEEAAEALRSLGISFTTVDVDRDPPLLAAYNEAVPVVLVDGHEIARAPITVADLERAWSRLSAPPARAPR